ncbi:MAG TPA: DNA helicase PriA [Methanocorpusculum sp.]|nr:DNA helicase PriA [Methanocorpusculum sp.]HJJ27507.1 DNA helicase PriA [Methanocorpusculum sp.]
MPVRHSCGYTKEIYCRECGAELTQNSRGQLICPRCGRRPAILCPNCGKLW